jgi:hypothetical protein
MLPFLVVTRTPRPRAANPPASPSSLAPFPLPLASNSFIICTSKKTARNPCRICTSKTKDLKPRRINTYKKTPGVGVLLLTRYPMKSICPERPTEAKDLTWPTSSRTAGMSICPDRPSGAKDLPHSNKPNRQSRFPFNFRLSTLPFLRLHQSARVLK